MKEAVTKVIDTLIHEDFHRAFKKLLERHNKYIAVGWDYFERDKSFICVLSIKVPIWKKSGNLFNDPRILLVHLFFSHLRAYALLQLNMFTQRQISLERHINTKSEAVASDFVANLF